MGRVEVAAFVVDFGSCTFVLSRGKRALVCGYGIVGTDCASALRGMVLLMAQCREHPGV